MKKGKYFLIPEGPADIDVLWGEAKPLQPADLPSWLSPEDAAAYRCAGVTSCIGLSAEEKARYFAELEQVEAAGLIAEPYPDGVHRLFVDEWKKNKYDIWSVGIYSGTSPFDLVHAEDVENPVLTRESVSDVPAVFVADPFLLQADGAWHMFFEVLNWRADKGEIGLATSENGLNWTYRQIVLVEPFHLSYPYVFEWADDFYMIPECHQTGSVRLYRALQFPTQWSLQATLLRGPYFADPSIFRLHDKWWLFVETNPDQKHDTLRLYYADDLMGPWFEHPKSPVIEGNPRISRPGGRILVLGDTVIRYAQDCYPHYGTGLRAFEITDLTTTRYQEREVQESPVLSPSGAGWNACGMHHIDPHRIADGKWIASVDGWSTAQTG
jgi:hypothetical protein